MLTTKPIHLIHAELLAEADRQHAEHPQYKGRFDHWVVVRCKVTQWFREPGVLEPVCSEGDFVLMDPASFEVLTGSFTPELNGKMTATFFLPTFFGDHGCNSSRFTADFEVIG